MRRAAAGAGASYKKGRISNVAEHSVVGVTQAAFAADPTTECSATVSGTSYGINQNSPLMTAAWERPPRKLSGTGGLIQGAQLPGR